MKKLSLFLTFALFFVLAGNAYALGLFPTTRIGSQAAVRQPLKIQNDADKVQNLKQRADTEIVRRTTSLAELITKINTLKKLSVTDKSNFVSQIQTQIDSLNTLKTKIDADTDLATLKTDVQSIVQSYRIYALFLPQVRILVTADSMSETADNLTALSTKLQTLITASGVTGDTLTNVQNLLSGMQAKVKDESDLYQSVETEVLALTPQGYPGNKTTLMDAKSKLKTGLTDIKTARDDVKQIVKILRSPNNPLNATGSSTLIK